MYGFIMTYIGVKDKV